MDEEPGGNPVCQVSPLITERKLLLTAGYKSIDEMHDDG
jgi:hypothetical protein